jgi:hypothetical protein
MTKQADDITAGRLSEAQIRQEIEAITNPVTRASVEAWDAKRRETLQALRQQDTENFLKVRDARIKSGMHLR